MNYIKEVLKTEDGRWNLHTIANFKSVGTIADVEGVIKGVQLAVLNTGGGNSMREFLGDVKNVTSRLRQMISDRINCRPTHAPKKEMGEKSQHKKARGLLYGGLLVKEENMLAQERSVLTQNVAFNAVRKYANNAEQKRILREWGKFWIGRPQEEKSRADCADNGRNIRNRTR